MVHRHSGYSNIRAGEKAIGGQRNLSVNVNLICETRII